MARVSVVYLPSGESGKKQGVDDFLVAGHTMDDLLNLATTELREPPNDEFKPDVPYRATPHGFLWEKPTKEGSVLTPLTNFTARIVTDVVKDDSVEVFREFEMEARRGDTVASFTIPAAHFGGMNWAVEHLGAGAVVYAGFGLKDHARAAIQLLSGNASRRHEYAHLGWREIDGMWVYLHGGGAIGASSDPAVTPGGSSRDPYVTALEIRGSRHEGRQEAGSGTGVTSVTPSEIYTQLPSAMAHYALPTPPSSNDLAKAVRASIRAAEVANLAVTMPGFAAVWRAPLGPTDFGLHYHGRTGLGKSELSALFQQHYGAEMNARNLPASWSSTANANEGLAFSTKDAVMVVDDFAPTGSTADQARLHRDADRLFRGKGNALGRQRMRPDGTLRPQKPPRALILSTGEDVPRGHSLRSRMLVVNMDGGNLDWQRLTKSQKDGAKGLYSQAMAAYLKWLAPRYGNIQATFRQEIEEEREGLRREGQHPRTPEIMANLRIGLRYFLRFAVEVGAITEAQAKEYKEAWYKALTKVDLDQSRYHASEDPVEQFLDLVRASVTGGSAHLASQKNGREPESNPGHWGWQHRPGYNELDEWIPRGTKIGWVSATGEDIFLSADNAYAVAQELARKQNTNIPVSKETLIKYLKERGLLASIEQETGRATPRKRMAGKVTRVLHLSARTLFPEGPNDDGSDDGPGGAQGSPSGDEPGPRGGPGTSANGDICAPANQAVSPHNLVEGSQGSRQAEEARSDVHLAVTPALPEGSPNGHEADTRGSRRKLVGPGDMPALVEGVRSAVVVALDLETTGLDPKRDKIRLLSLTTEQESWVLDLFDVHPAPVLAALKGKELVIHNAAFDLKFLSEFGYEHEGEVIDTMLLSQLLYAGANVLPLKKGRTSHSLDAVCQRELGVELDKTQQTATWGGELTPEMLEYAARDAEVLIPLHQKLIQKIEEAALSHVLEIEQRVRRGILWMAQAGVPFDEPRWLELAGKAKKEAAQLNERLQEMAPPHPEGKVWNWNSPQQIKTVLAAFDLHLPNTKDETLAKYDHEFVRLLREYKKKNGLATRHGEKWLRTDEGIDRVIDGRMYPNWKQIGAATGRMACADPNLQAIPHGSGHHSSVKAPEGRVLVRADYSQIELRLAAKLWSEPVMLETFCEGGDVHTTTARSITGKEEVTKEERKLAKAVNFGLIFGQGAEGLRTYAKNNYGVKMTLEEASNYRKRFFETYKGIARWHAKTAARMNRGEYETRTLSGRLRQDVRSYTEHLNAPVQGTAADGMKLALALLWERRHECPGVVPVLAVHDEIVVECDADKAEETKEWLVRAMKDAMDEVVNTEEPYVPIEVEASVSGTWGD